MPKSYKIEFEDDFHQQENNVKQSENDKIKAKSNGQNDLSKNVNNKDYQEDNDLNLSDLDEDQKKELLELEAQIENESLTRGERRRLQNKRNVLKAKIKKELEIEGHKVKISKLQKKLVQLRQTSEQGEHYKKQRDSLKEENRYVLNVYNREKCSFFFSFYFNQFPRRKPPSYVLFLFNTENEKIIIINFFFHFNSFFFRG